MTATATAQTPEPSAIESEIQAVKERRERLKDRRDDVEADLEDARTTLQHADTDEGADEALDRAERLQVQYDTLTEAIEDQTVKVEELREDLAASRKAHRREEKMDELAELGRDAMDAREDYEAVRDEITKVLREKAPELADTFSAWLTAADDFRTALVDEERHVYRRLSSTTKADRERAEGLISELKERGVTRMKDALAPHHTSVPARRWQGWSHEDGYTGPGDGLADAVEEIRSFGNQLIHSDE